MSKLTMVYQDCPTCGNRKEWGERTIAKAKESGLDIEFVSFATPTGQHLCKLAIYAGITKLPFITDGNKFSKDIADFIEAEKAPKSFAEAIEDKALMATVAEKADKLQQETLKAKKKSTRKTKRAKKEEVEDVSIE